ncbi:class I SAM-dependent methyltransferase [Minwuia sp.]|uniref:class I SAM-dependent methyltransferase n=1 Tax=Minwuia sp. TaxID=2493630 RepID=UPI003A8F2B65
MAKELAAGDFTGLAAAYSKNRPDYAESVLKGLVGMVGKPVAEMDVADVGAGTGIWTRMIHDLGPKSIVAVEPNDDMRSSGEADSRNTSIEWIAGSAEVTNLPDGSKDWLTMASSFHWADFDVALREFHRVLRPGGRFTAIWNPRMTEANPVTHKIEEYLTTTYPDVRRVSSGRAGLANELTEKLWACEPFTDVVYLEGRHTIHMSVDRYLGAWRSVNDLPVQIGAENFARFLTFVEETIAGLETIEAVYLTRAWSAARVD